MNHPCYKCPDMVWRTEACEKIDKCPKVSVYREYLECSSSRRPVVCDLDGTRLQCDEILTPTFPTEIKIGGYLIAVKEVDNLMTDFSHLGEYAPRTQEIRLEPTLTDQSRLEVLVHEILEAIKSIYDLNLDHGQLTLLATVLHQIFVDNPKVLDLFKQ